MNVTELLFPLKINGILTSLLCGFIIGLERQLSGKPTGIRTSSLICLGTYIFVAAGGLFTTNTDPSRIVGQVITGIGFIGAGVILSREGIVIGVTSAAVIWVLAGIGVLIGLERYFTASLSALITVIILIGMNILESLFKSFQKGVYKRIHGKPKNDTDEV